MTDTDRDNALAGLARIGRTRLAHVPTPLLPAPGLARALDAGIPLSIKADAWTGFGLGGNKVRKLEYELDPARLEGVTHLITAGGPHSNHCRVTAAAAATLGLECVLVVNGHADDESRGNAALHRLLGARIVTVAERPDRQPAMEEQAARIAAEGGKALIVPLGASTPRGSLGYVHAALELYEQVGAEPTMVFLASSSGGTLAGFVLGCAILDWHPTIVAVSADEPAGIITSTAATLAEEAACLLPTSPRARQRVGALSKSVRATDAFVGPGYGVATPDSDEATRLFGRHAGVVLDPVYTAKAGAALVAELRAGVPDDVARAVFLHTGGHPALFR